jgi:hypothetical protein
MRLEFLMIAKDAGMRAVKFLLPEGLFGHAQVVIGLKQCVKRDLAEFEVYDGAVPRGLRAFFDAGMQSA